MHLRMLSFVLLLPALAGADDVPPPQMVTFTPASAGTTAAPIVGVSHTETQFLLCSSNSTRYLPLDFTGSNQDYGLTPNDQSMPTPATAKDAASYNSQWHFQLDTNNSIRVTNTTTGDAIFAFGTSGTLPVPRAFGIGYDGVSDTLAVGTFAPASGILGLTLYPHVSLGQNLQPSLHLTIPFDPSQWGTPSGLDYHNYRFLVATRDQNLIFLATQSTTTSSTSTPAAGASTSISGGLATPTSSTTFSTTPPPNPSSLGIAREVLATSSMVPDPACGRGGMGWRWVGWKAARRY